MIFLLWVPLAAEDVELDTPYEDDPTLYIPEDYDTLREYYIDLAELYQEQRYDLEQEIDNVDILLTQQKRLMDLQLENTKILNGVKDDLDKPTLPEFLNHGPLIGVGTSINYPYTAHIGYQITILDSLVIQAQGQFPFGISVLIGWEF